MSVEAKTFEQPDETVTFERGRVQVVTVGSMTIGHEVAEPGWRWSEHVKPIVGTEWCEFHHAMYVLSGRMRVLMRDGETHDVVAGQVVDITPGHDAWVVGDQPVTSIDLQGSGRTGTRPGARRAHAQQRPVHRHRGLDARSGAARGRGLETGSRHAPGGRAIAAGAPSRAVGEHHR
jgi:quercetin dioxygenase-like cupin family protein